MIGTTAHLTANLFQTGDTLASRIAAQYQGAASNLQVASLFYLGVILLVISLITNFAAQLIVRRYDDHREGTDVEAASLPALAEGDRPVAAAPASRTASPQAIAILAALLAVAVLGVVVVSVLLRGVPALNLDLFTKNQVDVRRDRRRHRQRRSSARRSCVALATAIALPIGILVAIYVARVRAEPGRALRPARARRPERRARRS